MLSYVIGLVDGVVTVVPPRDDNPNKNLIVIENKHKVSGGYSGNVYDLDAAHKRRNSLSFIRPKYI